MAIAWNFPSTWGTKNLGDIAPESSDQIRPSERSADLFNYWGLDVIEPGSFIEPEPNWVVGSKVSSTCVKFDTSHVLYSKLRPYLNKVIVPSRSGIGSTEWVPLKPNPEFIDRYYLAYVLRTGKFIHYAEVNSTGARMPRVRKSALWDADVPVPFPLDPARSLVEQRRIVARIEALLAEVREMRKLHDEITADANKLMRAAFRDIFPHSHHHDHPGWSWVKLGDLGQVTGGGTPRKAEKSYWKGTIPWVSPKDMKTSVIKNTQDHVTEKGIRNSAAKLLPAKSILIVFRSGILAHSLPVAIAARELTINQDMKAITPRSNFAPEFIAYAIKAREQHFVTTCVKKGPTVHSIVGDRFWQEKIPVPDSAHSLNSQRQIVAYLDAIQEEISEISTLNNLDVGLLEALEQAILAQAFRGEL
jgi:type I restriction enzyme, S subunit